MKLFENNSIARAKIQKLKLNFLITLSCKMLKNGQTYFKNLAVYTDIRLSLFPSFQNNFTTTKIYISIFQISFDDSWHDWANGCIKAK